MRARMALATWKSFATIRYYVCSWPSTKGKNGVMGDDQVKLPDDIEQRLIDGLKLRAIFDLKERRRQPLDQARSESLDTRVSRWYESSRPL
jgi:hypothetical protein